MANIKITDLVALTDPASTDVLPVVDIANDETKKVAVGEIVGKISGDVDVATDGTSSIAAGVIFDADVNASAAIAGTKIDPDFGSQTVETTGVFSAAGGAAATPSIAFTGDLNTGIYSPGADQVAISTNGTGRLFIDASGKVGIGTTSVLSDFHIASSLPTIRLEDDDVASQASYALIKSSSDGGLQFDADPGNARSSTSITFDIDGGEKARIDSSGRLLVGTSTATGIEASLVSVGGNAANFFRFGSDNTTVTIGSVRGTQESPSTLNNNEIIGTLDFRGHDGTSYISGANIQAVVDGGVSNGNFPTRLVFSVNPGSPSTGPTERVQINSSGALQLLAGCPGIDFSGIQTNAAGMTSETLDSYEEGTWTPSYQTSNSDISITNTTVDHAVYTKIGNRVFCTCRFYSNISSVGTGTVRVTGLPFSTASTQGDVSCTISFAVRFATAAPLTAVLRGSATELDLITVFTDTTTTGNVTYMPAANLRTGGVYNIISISFNYSV